MSETLRNLIVRWRALDEEEISSDMSSGNFFADELEAVLAAAPNNGPACHKCGKLVEEGDILCSEHEQEMILALGAAHRHRLQELHDKWIGIFHELSTEHFGNRDAEHIANTYRVCAEELEVIALLQSTSYAEKSKEDK